MGNSGHAVHAEQYCPQLTSVLPCRHESDTTDLYCIFDPHTAHRLAEWEWDWKENHQMGQADLKVGSLQCQWYLRKSPKFGEGGTDLIVSCRLKRCAGPHHPRLDSASAPSWHAMPPCTSFAGAITGH